MARGNEGFKRIVQAFALEAKNGLNPSMLSI
jgi:hypothetical protein